MPNIKGAIKRVRQTATVTERNTQFKTAMRKLHLLKKTKTLKRS